MFDVLRKYRMKLNLLKCSFGVAFEKFLGFVVNSRGIEANSKKIQAIKDIRTPETLKHVQSLNGKVATLSCFISTATDNCIPFFDLVKKGKRNFQWTRECADTFNALVQHLATPPILSKPMDHEKLYIYLAATVHAISAALLREKTGSNDRFTT